MTASTRRIGDGSSPTSAIPCRLPLIDPHERALTPIGTAIFVVFVTLWTAMAAALLMYRLHFDRESRLAEAVAESPHLIRYKDEQGVERQSMPPTRKGWRPTPGQTLQIRYLPGADSPPEFAEEAAVQRHLGIGFVVIGLALYGFAWFLHQRMKSDDARRARLKHANLRVPASGFRIGTERRGRKSRHDEFRVFAQFSHGGKWFEAASDLFVADPTVDIDASRLAVWLDPR